MDQSGLVSKTKGKPNAVLVSVQLPDVSDDDHRASLEELARLVHTLGYHVVATLSQKRKTLSASSLVGEGKLQEIAQWTEGDGVLKSFSKHTSHAINNSKNDDQEEESGFLVTEKMDEKSLARFVVFDNDMSPRQCKNLEDALGAQVMDRTGVIIEIFHRHAHTPAAKAQVEIARLTYLAPKVREAGAGDRQGGGVGAKGVGETQHELDRRRIRDRIAELRQELVAIHHTDSLRRERRSDTLKVALVGYTNAGKSSLMRALTGSEVLVADKLFATLDTTVRAMYPETKPRILVSDTVGFIKKLPHDLVASFKSTLDEALNASLLLFVVDASDPSFESQLATTKAVLAEIGADNIKSLLVLNKTDRLTEAEKHALQEKFPDGIFVSALDPLSVAQLRGVCVTFFQGSMVDVTWTIPYSKSAAVAEIYNVMHVVSKAHDEFGTTVTVRGFRADVDRIQKLYALSESL